jgi:hypothetical protein
MQTRTFTLYIAAAPDRVWRALDNLFTGIGAARDAHCWLTWELTAVDDGALTRARLTCDDLDARPHPDRDEAWSRIVSGLKTVAESGAPRM